MRLASRACGAVASGTLLGVASSTAWAGPPFVTDDPEPVEIRHWEINTALTGSWRGGEASIGLPSVDINYGAGPDLQLHAQPRFSIERGDGTQKGIDDTELGAKWRFLEIKKGGGDFMLGIYPMYQAATGARRLGPDRGTHGVLLPVWAQYGKGDWMAYGGSGYRINRGGGARNSVFTGATLLRRMSETLQLGIEAFHETATSDAGGSASGFNVGGSRVLSERFNLLFSAGRSFGDSRRYLMYLGLQSHF